jgi:hypothetical protein
MPFLLAQVHYVQVDDATDIPYVRDSMAELPVSVLTIFVRIVGLVSECCCFQEWDWAFGQTPEFTYSISRSFEWGNVVSQPTMSPVCHVF